MMNIILAGFMGSGKSSTARFISKKYNFRFVDTDKIIEKTTNMKIKEIFDKSGETFFRNLERKIIYTNLKFCQECVISTGGGMPCYYNNMEMLKKIGWVFWLNISFEDILNRISNKSTRPLLNDINKAKELYNKRIPCYSKAHFKIDASKKIETVANNIIKKFNLN